VGPIPAEQAATHRFLIELKTDLTHTLFTNVLDCRTGCRSGSISSALAVAYHPIAERPKPDEVLGLDGQIR